LYGAGARAFSVSGGTTPSVNETNDQGSLQKNLSQTGTYTLGGDKIVLSGGNAASVTLGTGTSHMAFIGPSSLLLTGGSGSAIVTADAGTNTFAAGAGSLDVTGGGGKDTYVFHANSGMLTIEDFSAAKGDKLTIDSGLKGSMVQGSDGQGGTLITFGSGASQPSTFTAWLLWRPVLSTGHKDLLALLRGHFIGPRGGEASFCPSDYALLTFQNTGAGPFSRPDSRGLQAPRSM
jgi:hypothetical protein